MECQGSKSSRAGDSPVVDLSIPRASLCVGTQALTSVERQRPVSTGPSTSASGSPLRGYLAPSAATAFAAGAVGWYFHLYGYEAFAMTPQEEG